MACCGVTFRGYSSSAGCHVVEEISCEQSITTVTSMCFEMHAKRIEREVRINSYVSLNMASYDNSTNYDFFLSLKKEVFFSSDCRSLEYYRKYICYDRVVLT